MNIIRVTFEGEPIPAPRPKFSNGHAYNVQQYRAYKQALADFIQCKYGYWAWDIPLVGDKARPKHIKSNPYVLHWAVFRSKDVGDKDNFEKTIQDAIQLSGVIANDSQFKAGSDYMGIDKDNPRTEFIVRPFTEGHGWYERIFLNGGEVQL